MDVKQSKTLNIAIGVALLGLNLVLFNVIASNSGLRVRSDLTEGNRYTLSEVTRTFIEELERPSELIFYYSSPKSMPPVVKPLVDPLRDALAEFAVESEGRVRTRFVELDTAGKKAQEDAANAFGVRPMNIPVVTAYEDTIKSVYFSVVVSCGDQFEHIPLVPGPLVRIIHDRESFGVKLELNDTEYVIVKALRKVAGSFNSLAGALVGHDLQAKVTCYLSSKAELPEHLKEIGSTVESVTEGLRKDAPGRIELVTIDPFAGKDTTEQKRAAAEQLMRTTRITPIAGRDTDFYSWLMVEVGGKTEVLPVYSLGTELGESEVKDILEGSLKRLVPGFLPTVGIVASRPPAPPQNPMMPQRPPPDPFQVTREMLGEDFQTKDVELGSGTIPRDVDILLLLRPGDLAAKEIFALDQFVMRGGRLVVCAGGFHMDAQAMSRGISLAREGGARFRDWLAHFGVDTKDEIILDTRSSTLAIPQYQEMAFGMQQVVGVYNVKYPFFLRMGRDGGMNSAHPITAFLQGAGLFWASPVSLGKVPEGAEGTVLLETTGEASTTSSGDLVQRIIDVGYNPGTGPLGRIGSVIETVWDEADRALKREAPFPPTWLGDKLNWMLDIETGQYSTAVAVKGHFTSYFADKPVPGTETDPTAPKAADDKPEEPPRKQTAPLDKSRDEGSIVVFGDSDFVSHLPYREFGLDESVLRENMRLLSSALEWSSGDVFASIRNRRVQNRPLSKLVGLDPEEREHESVMATVWTSIITLLTIPLFAAAWFGYRAMRPPLNLMPPGQVTEGDES